MAIESGGEGRVLSGRYELQHLVARGGMAEVYRARDRLLDRPVALKILFPELSVDRSFVERFRREAQAAANLSHPNIVPVFDWGEDGGTYFIVMEYVDGRSLSSILRQAGTLHPERAAEIAADVAAALAYAHRHGVIHRDVKPGNVLITEEGAVKVTDFGIARAINTEESLTQTGAVMGTATYFSPEQAEGLGVDARSDVYSLGVVLYEMVVGRPPFLGDTPVAVASKHVREYPPTPRELNPSVPPALEAVIMKCMAKSPEHRYATGDDLRVDLLRFREGREVAASMPPTAMEQAVGATGMMSAVGHTQALPAVAPYGVRRGRNRWWVAALVALLVALLVVVLLLGDSLGWWHLTSSSVTLPNLAGKSVAAAEAELSADGLKSTTQSDPSSNQPNTTVLRTNPKSGSSVPKGSTVTLITGNRGNKVTLQNYVNQSVAEATQQLQQLGLQATVTNSSNCNQLNIVCDQSPNAGALVDPGSSVTLFTAPATTTTTTTTTTTAPETAVPDVSGLAPTAACNKLGLSGFTCGTTTEQPSSAYSAGYVISTTPQAGTPEPQGTTVNLIVSSGPPTTTVPDLSGESPAQAQQTLQQAGLQGNAAANCSVGLSPTVKSQNPAAGQTVAQGSTVNYSC
ncbi:MAG: Stk1 family PASTA domain-containing Ser/Thr kinase [Acidimicrobiales bacterium]